MDNGSSAIGAKLSLTTMPNTIGKIPEIRKKTEKFITHFSWMIRHVPYVA